MRVGIDGQCLSAAQVAPAHRRFVWQVIAAFGRGPAGVEFEVLALDPSVTAALARARIPARTAILPPAAEYPARDTYARRVNAAYRAAWLAAPPDIVLIPDLMSPETALIEPFGGLPMVALLADLPGKEGDGRASLVRTARRAARLRDAGAWFLVASLRLRDWLSAQAGVPSDRIETLPTPVDLQRFRPPRRDEAKGHPYDPFILTMACGETLPHMENLFRAHAQLGPSLKKVKLVAAADLEDRRLCKAVRAAAEAAGADPGSWRLESDDAAAMSGLYRAARIFIYPANEDYIGAPLLEALASGCPVICSDTGALPELAGTAALTGPPGDVDEMAERLGRWLRQEHERQAWAAKGPQRAKKFEARNCAARLLQSFHQEFLPEEPVTGDLRMAYVSPLPPAPTGVAQYSKCLARELREYANIDLYAPEESRRDPVLQTRFQIFPVEELPVRHAKYDVIVYNMGNNLAHHREIFGLMDRIPGVTILHDINLHGFFYSWHKERLGPRRGTPGPFANPAERLDGDPYYNEMVRCYGAAGAEEARRVVLEGFPPDETRFLLNRRITRRSRAVVVHSQWAAMKLLENGDPPLILPIPLGAQPEPQVDQEGLREFRERLQSKDWKFTVGVGGFFNGSRRLDSALRAIAELRRRGVEAGLALIGEMNAGIRRQTMELAGALGISDEILFTGYMESHEAFIACLAGCDVVVNLRQPSVGETSAMTHLAMSLGKPVLATDSPVTRELPPQAVFRIAADDLEIALTASALEGLARRPGLRQAMGQAGREYILREAAWPGVARRLSQFLYTVARRYRHVPAAA